MPVNEEFRETPYKKKMMENTDEVEMLQYVSVSLVLLDLVLNIYKIWAARLQTMQILASNAAAQPRLYFPNSSFYKGFPWIPHWRAYILS